MRIAI
jgi:hypothetical protein